MEGAGGRKWGLHVVTECSTDIQGSLYTIILSQQKKAHLYLLERGWWNFAVEHIYQDRPRRAFNRKISSLCLRLKDVAAKEIKDDGSLDERDLACVDVQERLHQLWWEERRHSSLFSSFCLRVLHLPAFPWLFKKGLNLSAAHDRWHTPMQNPKLQHLSLN